MNTHSVPTNICHCKAQEYVFIILQVEVSKCFVQLSNCCLKEVAVNNGDNGDGTNCRNKKSL